MLVLLAASVYIEKGMFAEAIAESRKEYELSGGNVIPFGAYALAKSENATRRKPRCKLFRNTIRSAI